MDRVVHFEINAPEPEKVQDFYAHVFGWEIAKWEGPEDYWLVTTGDDGAPGINGGLMTARDGTPRTVVTVEVDDLDASMADVSGHGGKIVVDKMAVPGVGWMAYCVDTQGGMMGMMQPDENAE